jgi:hypothetical protein
MGSFDRQQFVNQKGTLSEKLETVFNSIGATATGDRSTSDYGRIIGYGSLATVKEVTPTDNLIPLQIAIASVADATGGATFAAAFFQTRNRTVDQPGTQLATVVVSTRMYFDLLDAYGLQSHMYIMDSKHTAADNAHVTAISGKLFLETGKTLSKGWANAGLFIVEGAGAVTQMCYGVSIVAEAGAAACQALLHLYSDETINAAIAFTEATHFTNLFDFAATNQGFLTTDAAATAANRTHKIKIDIGGVAGYINVNAA